MHVSYVHLFLYSCAFSCAVQYTHDSIEQHAIIKIYSNESVNRMRQYGALTVCSCNDDGW